MKTLNEFETSCVSGGVDPVVLLLGTFTFLNVLSIMNLNNRVEDATDIAVDAFVLTLYNDAQLQMLPFYDEVAMIPFSDLLK